MTEIRNAVIIFSSKELENLTTGIPLTLNCVNGLLWVIYLLIFLIFI